MLSVTGNPRSVGTETEVGLALRNLVAPPNGMTSEPTFVIAMPVCSRSDVYSVWEAAVPKRLLFF
jgi:hypothetical protein